MPPKELSVRSSVRQFLSFKLPCGGVQDALSALTVVVDMITLLCRMMVTLVNNDSIHSFNQHTFDSCFFRVRSLTAGSMVRGAVRGIREGENGGILEFVGVFLHTVT